MKFDDLERVRDELVAGSRSAQAQPQELESLTSIDVMDPASELARFEENVRRDEARVGGGSNSRRRRPTRGSTRSTTFPRTLRSRTGCALKNGGRPAPRNGGVSPGSTT